MLGVHLLNVDRILVIPHTRCAMTASTQQELRERVADRPGRTPPGSSSASSRTRWPRSTRTWRKVHAHPLDPGLRPGRRVPVRRRHRPHRAQGLALDALRHDTGRHAPARAGAAARGAPRIRRRRPSRRRSARAGVRRGRHRQVQPRRGLRRRSHGRTGRLERPATAPSRRRRSGRCRTWPTSGAARSGSPAPTGCRARRASPRCCRCCASTVTTGASPCWSWRTCTSPTRRPWTWSATSRAACAGSAPWWSRPTATTASPRTAPCARPSATPRRCAPPGGSPCRRSPRPRSPS